MELIFIGIVAIKSNHNMFQGLLWKEEKMEEKILSEHDKCVLCGEETKYPKGTHINFREHYIEDAGQLCPQCYQDIYDIRIYRKWVKWPKENKYRYL